MTPNSFTHYQTCFKVQSSNSGYSPLYSLQKILYDWILVREEDRVIQNNSNSFIRKCDWSNLFQSRSSLATNVYYSDEFNAWGMRYSHLDRELGEKRYWYVDVGIKEAEEFNRKTATFYVRISFARSRFDLSLEHPAPDITTPGFVRDIIKRNSGLIVFSGAPEFRLFDQPVPLRVSHGKNLAEWILSKKRQYALVVVNSNSEILERESANLARDLAGKAQVIILDQDPELAAELRHYVPQDLWIPWGKFRVFYPINPDNPKPERHRWFDPALHEYSSQRVGLLNSLLRNYSLEENRPITNISEIGRLVSLSKLRKLVEDNKQNTATNADLVEFYSMFEEVEAERDGFKLEAEQWVAECDAKIQEINALKSKLNAFEFGDSKTNSQAYFDVETKLSRLPQNLEDVLEVKSQIHSRHLIFTQEAHKSAKEYSNCQVLDKAWEMIGHIATTLYDLKFGSKGVKDLSTEFQKETGFEYAPTEGKQSKADSEICKTRVVTHGSKTYEIWPHIIYGNREPKMLRIHFAFDEELKKIVVGFVGPHMPNATSKSIK